MSTSKKTDAASPTATLLFIFLVTIFGFSFLSSCDDDIKPAVDEEDTEDTTETPEPSLIDTIKIYIPKEFGKSGFSDSKKKWSYNRSKQSDHFVVFWDVKYGDKNPSSPEVPAAFRVDIDDLLAKAEEFYQKNVDELKFAVVGNGNSNLEKYKMMIFINHQTDWLATGSGYDDVIGALWVSPNTCQPVGHTIGHEIGHSFQYQVYADLKNGHGFRYGFGGNGGNSFWEQTAQWQAFQSYPEQVFTTYDFTVYKENFHRHIHHENYRYASYFIHYYWADKRGVDVIGKLWREAVQPEDPAQAYMRIYNLSADQFNGEIYEAASKFVTWDLPALKTFGENYIGAQPFSYTKLEDGSYQVAYDRCPGTTGYNVIRLDLPAPGTVISTAFTGLVNEAGFNQVAVPSRAGWRFGYVALLTDGTRVYSPMNSSTQGNAEFTVPTNCKKLWFVVTGAPNSYAAHPWDDNEANDDQWPYKVKFTNTRVFGDFVFDGTEVPHDDLLTYSVTVPFSSTDYTRTTISLEEDFGKLANAFVLNPSQIRTEIGNRIKLYAVEANGSLNQNMTANNGHWFDSQGNVIAWGADAKVYSELNNDQLTFTIGQFPGHVTSGDEFTVKQALVYEYEQGKTVKVVFEFKIKIQ